MNELIEAVKRMRFCQNEYFKIRNYTTLHNAKEAEKKVDKMLVDIDADAKQLTLEMEKSE